jgi:ABC-2 type transport system permease protein
VLKLVAYPFLGLIVLGPSFAAGMGSWYFVRNGMDAYLAAIFWVVFAIWQLVGINTSTNAPAFDLSSLIRFPIRYRDYLLIRLSFGLLDPPTLIGLGCLCAATLGVAAAAPSLFLWAALSVLTYALCNILFSRMIYAWIERWLAQRRTRELVTAFILFFSLAVQFLVQYLHRFGGPRHGHAQRLSPAAFQAIHTLMNLNWYFPPGLAAGSIRHFHEGDIPLALASLLGLASFTALFLAILHRRLYAEFRGENLSEVPLSKAPRPRTSPSRLDTQSDTSSSLASNRKTIPLLAPVVSASLIKDLRYLFRSGPRLYALIMPVFMVLLLSVRNSGLSYAGLNRGSATGFLFCTGCAYMQLVLVALTYNSLGSDASGVQFYFLAPIRFRDVMLAKNLLTAGAVVVETVFIYLAVATLSHAPAPDLTIATVAWLIFSTLVNLAVGNVRSIVSPKTIDPAKVRRQTISGLNTLISLGVALGASALGAGVLFLSQNAVGGYWLASTIFAVLSVFAFIAYRIILNGLDALALRHRETLAAELCKAS